MLRRGRVHFDVRVLAAKSTTCACPLLSAVFVGYALLFACPSAAVAAAGRLQIYLAHNKSSSIAYPDPCCPLVDLLDRWVSAHANIRVASAARRGYGEALVICFRGGAFSAVLDLTLCVAGVTLLYVVLHSWYVSWGELDNTDVPVLMVGYGFGASFVALFMQVRGCKQRSNAENDARQAFGGKLVEGKI